MSMVFAHIAFMAWMALFGLLLSQLRARRERANERAHHEHARKAARMIGMSQETC
jgi:hypothetical protein